MHAFGLSEWPDWAEPVDRSRATQLREILSGLLDLESSDRALAGRLLRARSGPPPWDLRDDPANRRFLDRMRAAGIDPAPWLDSTPRVVHTGHGETLSLALCADPLDVFAMGAHFETCLSPRGGNFFSVVANAADINKRVLYARRDDRVVGRCLFAITDSLTLLAFNPYCHERIDFASIVRDFALELAARMRATIVTRGPVSTLVARDWYDDGARDLVGRFACLDESFDLEAIPPDELVGKLREALGRDLDDVTLPFVLGHRDFQKLFLPRHLAPLVPFILASNVSLIRIDAAQLALHNKDLELADRLLGDHDRAIRIEEYAWPNGEIVARLRPSRALARLRRSRPRSVRRWSDERGDRIALAGVALQALERPRKAAAMFRLAAKLESWLLEDMHARLTAMGAPIDGDYAD
jgi:hypothetical protein